MVQRTVLKVDIHCQKCQRKLLKAVSVLEGVDKLEVDAAKGTLTVTGDCDPYEIIVRTRKACKYAEVVSIGPPPKPPEKKPEQTKPKEKDRKPCPMPYYCPEPCQRWGIVRVDPCYDHNPSCSIM
ncbi:heavy metal-associated isoprenylated plant protein 12-like [Pyrus x bretschneideri]|uniref:heavy metal-associated isoprenylated plant protein 12-like n=1 Tax=Pyrus x bretschneideri TaxID=225117 RepID=UPI00051101F5|nr:heavy metal-associated isoprenylated plant protein 12-like [Pyrus x bretschneideri]